MDYLYLSDDETLDIFLEVSGLALDEVEAMVGRFGKNSQWDGKLRGCVVMRSCGAVQLRHHFTKELLWSTDG